jgi:hydrophobic/amphiphilic exporter-1 (mainly G- bacteria), HAE1 family
LFVDFFIHRPVFATVCALMIILAGAICIPNLPVAMYPTLAPPVVAVTATYVGADAETVEKAVTIPLEEAINGVEGMRYISSSSTNSGTSEIDITFQTGYNLDIAAVDVQNRVASVEGRLPGEVVSSGINIKRPPTTSFSARDFIRSMAATRASTFQLSGCLREGRAQARARRGRCGHLRRAQVRHARMARSGAPGRAQLTATDVVNALEEQNVEVPAGQLGQPPSDSKQAFQIPVRVVGRLSSPEEFDNIIVKNSPNGLVQLKDVGHAEVGAEDYSTLLEYAGPTAMGVGVEQLSNANALDVDRRARAALEQLSKSFPPGLQYAIAFDTTTAVGESIREVLVTLMMAIVIVIAVIFLFLLDWRATIIPAVTIPVSLIGTFAFIRIFDFSINSLTLFGITLATDWWSTTPLW